MEKKFRTWACDKCGGGVAKPCLVSDLGVLDTPNLCAWNSYNTSDWKLTDEYAIVEIADENVPIEKTELTSGANLRLSLYADHFELKSGQSIGEINPPDLEEIKADLGVPKNDYPECQALFTPNCSICEWRHEEMQPDPDYPKVNITMLLCMAQGGTEAFNRYNTPECQALFKTV